MFSKTWISKFTESFLDNVAYLKRAIEDADAILIGAGAGMSTAAGLTYSGDRFMRFFSDFNEKYGIKDMYSGGFYPFATLEEYWAWWSRHIYYNRYYGSAGQPYIDLLELLKGKNYFVITTNVDHQFQLAGFDRKRLFYTQGDYGLFQCSVPCHSRTYNNEGQIRRMLAEQEKMKIPTELIPKCPICGKPMTVNLRSDNTFVQDEGWYKACERYEEFVSRYQKSNILLLELGVGYNTPVIIKYPFWRMTLKNPNVLYICINHGEAGVPKEIQKRSISIDDDIAAVLRKLAG